MEVLLYILLPYGHQENCQTWKNDLYKNDPAKWGMAIANGDLVYKTEWMNNNSLIDLDLAGSNSKVFFFWHMTINCMVTKMFKGLLPTPLGTILCPIQHAQSYPAGEFLSEDRKNQLKELVPLLLKRL